MRAILSLWIWYPSVNIGCAGLVIGYLALVNFRPRRKFIPYLGGVLALIVALESPLDALGDSYLFSAHMLQHQLLILAAPPLLLLGIPEETARRVNAWMRRKIRRAKALGSPARSIKAGSFASAAIPWLIGVATIWVWHLPVLYDAALADERIHLVEHLSFLITATIFWWPVLSPLGEQRASLLARAAYLLLATVACDILGTLIAYAPAGLYPPYLKPNDIYGILPLIRDQWRITPSIDQQAGGLLMGITGDPVYILLALNAMSRWYHVQVTKDKIH